MQIKIRLAKVIEVENMENEHSQNTEPLRYDPSVKAVKVVISLFCSDSRNVTADYYNSKEKVLDALEAQGIMVEFEKLNDPGTFMTAANISKIKEKILKAEARYSNFAANGVGVEYEIHVVSHGQVHRKPEYATQKAFHPEQLEVMNCCTNCGMMHARHAMEALQNFILEAKPTFTVDGKKMHIGTPDDLKAYMKVHFRNHDAPKGWDGDLLTWLEPVKDVRTHSVEQIAKFEKAAAEDARLAGILPRIRTFAEVLNYESRGFHRVDGKREQEDIVLRPIFKDERQNGTKEDKAEVVAPQPQLNPVLVVSGTLYNTRKLIRKHLGSRAFSLAGDTRKDENFGPYATLGFLYALSPDFLNKDATDPSKPGKGMMVVLGKDKEEMVRLLDKIDNDNIVKLIVKHHARTIHHMVDPRQHFRHRNPNIQDRSSPKVKHSRIR